jgi:hypothetical protein
MAYRDYLRLEGTCSIVLGLALALLAFPGLLVSWSGLWTAPLFVAATLAALAAHAALRRGVPPLAAGRWLTEHPLGTARPGREALDASRLRRRLVIETAIWIVAVAAWVLLARESGLLIFGTGLASAAFGVVQAFAARARVTGAERTQGRRYAVSRRPGLGTPELTFTP